MTTALLWAAILLALVFVVNLLRARRMQPEWSTIRLVPGALFLTESFVLRLLGIVLFVVGIPLLLFALIGNAVRPR